MAVKIGITGGIGSGKSMVSKLLSLMDIPVYDSDREAKKLIQNDEIIKIGLCELLGGDLYKEGQLDKIRLSSYLFDNHENAIKVNAVVHPRVKEHFSEWVAVHNHNDIIALESAILVESGFRECVDKVVWVTAPLELRIERAVLRDHSSRELVLKRVQAQMSDEERKCCADFILENDDDTPLIPQVICLIERLRREMFS